MAKRFTLLVSTATLLLACGGDDGGAFSATPGADASAGGGSGGTSAGGSPAAGGRASAGGSGTGGSGTAGTSTGGANQGGTNSGGGGANPGGAGGTSAGGTNPGGAGGSGQGGSSGAPGDGGLTCPGTAIGCVMDWAGQFGTCPTPGSGCPNQDGTGTQARFSALGDITGDGTNIYVSDDSTIRAISIRTAQVTTLAGSAGQTGYADLVGANARFGFVDGVATDGTTVWVVDGGNHVIRAVTIATGAVTTVAGTSGSPGFVDATGAAARFEGIRGMTFDGTYLYVTESVNQAIRRIDPTNGDVATVAGGNGAGTMDGNGLTTAQFDRPRDLHAMGGSLYVGDTENNRIRLVTLGSPAAVSTIAGSVAGFADATGTAAQFRRLRGVSDDGTDLLVGDSDNFVIRRVDLPGYAVTTIAGTVGNQAHAVGIGSAAAMDKPMDIHFDAGTGDLFIVEGTVIRRMRIR